MPSAIDTLSVRLCIDTHPVGSGFVLAPATGEHVYILTARHCFAALTGNSHLSIDWYVEEQQGFVSLTLQPAKYRFLAFPAENPYDGAVLVIARDQLLVQVGPVIGQETAQVDQTLRFTGYPAATQHNQPVILSGVVLTTAKQTFQLQSLHPVEDNTTTAYGNVQGFSGSGIYYTNGEVLIVVGILCTFKKEFHRFQACTLLPLNLLLQEAGHEPIPLSISPPVPSQAVIPVDVSDFIGQCKRLLDEAEQCWLGMQPRQGLTLVHTVQRDINEALLPAVQQDQLLARVYYLEALLAGDLGDDVDGDTLFINAHARMPHIKEYQERAAQAYLTKEDREAALKTAEKLIKGYPLNPYGWLVLVQLGLYAPEDVMPAVQREPAYKVGYINKLGPKRENGTVNIQDYIHLFQSELTQRRVPTHVDRKTIYYWSYVAQFILHELLARLPYVSSMNWPTELLNNPQLLYAASLLRLLCERVENTDLHDRPFFQVLRFEYCYCQYFVTQHTDTRQRMAEEMAKLFIGYGQDERLPFSPNRPPAMQVIPHRLVDLMQILHHQQQGKLMLDALAVNTYLPQEPIWQLFRGMAYRLLGQRAQQRESFCAFLAQTDELDDMDVLNFMDPIRLLLDDYSFEELHGMIIDGKQFKVSYAKLILEAYLWSLSMSQKDRGRSQAELIKPHWDELSLPLKQMVTRIFMSLGDWTSAKDYLAQLCPPGEESDDLLFYIHALYEEGQEVSRFLELAAHWRTHYTPHQLLIKDELAIYRRWRNYAKLEEVASYGLLHFPQEVTYWWDLVRALFQQRPVRQEALLVQLTRDKYVFDTSFTLESQFTVAHICLSSGLMDKGVAVAYQALMNYRDNPKAADKYFMLSTRYQAFDALPTPTTATKDMVVLVRKENAEPQYIELSEEALRHNPLAQAVVDHQAGDTITLTDKLMNRQERFELLQLYNKYVGQWMLIAKKTGDPYSGLAARSMTIPTDETGEFDFAGFERLLQDIAGEEGTKRKLRVDQQQARFAKGEIGFSELCASCFNGNPVAAWQYATSDQADGFTIMPLCLQPAYQPYDDTEYVLDFSSVLSLYFMQQKQPLVPLAKPFVVSQFLLDYVISELEEARHDAEQKLTQEVSLDRIVTHAYPDDYKQRRIAFYTDLLAWLTAMCRPDYAPERIERSFMERSEERDLFGEDNLFASSVLDTYLLANRPQRIFITDDLTPHQSLQNALRVITTEHFLLVSQPTLHKEQGWLALVNFNFRGLTLEVDQLYQVFTRSLLAETNQSSYRRAAYNFSRQYNPDIRLSARVIQFAKRVYLHKLSLEFKRQVVQGLLRRHFLGHPELTPRIIAALKTYIDREFRLIGNLGDYTKEDVDIALGHLL